MIHDTMVIAMRELRERVRLFWMAAALALVPFAIAAVPTARGNRPLTIAVAAGVLGLAFVFGVALALGVSVIGRDLAENRLSFYFAKPLSPAALWTGKAIASLITIASVALIVILPGRLAGAQAWSGAWAGEGRPLVSLLTAIALSLFFGTHALATMVRSRSVFIAFDFVLAVLAVVSILAILMPLVVASQLEFARPLLKALGASVLVVLACAPMWQLAGGRTDKRRNHVALSKALWSGIAVVILVAAGYATWLRSAPLPGLKINAIEQTSGGRRVFIMGEAPSRRGFPTEFIVDPVTGVRDRVSTPGWRQRRLSDDGRVTAWTEADSFLKFDRLRLYVRNFDEVRSANEATPITLSFVGNFALSPDGTRVATAERDTIAVYELPSGRLIAAAKSTSEWPVRQLFFATRDVVRIIGADYRERPGLTMSIEELDVRSRRLTKSAEVAIGSRYRGAVTSDDASRMLLRQTFTVVDGRTGDAIAVLPVKPSSYYSAAMLRDGTLVAATEGVMHVFDRDVKPSREINIPPGKHVVTGQIGESAVMLQSKAGVTVVDLARGAVRYTVPNVKGPGVFWSPSLRLLRYADDAVMTGVERPAKLVTWDAQTGKKRDLPM